MEKELNRSDVDGNEGTKNELSSYNEDNNEENEEGRGD